MPSLLELVRSHTDLDEADVAVLQLLMADWQIIADLSFADLVLWLPDRGGDGFWAAAQMRPTTGPTAYVDDIVGSFVPTGRRPMLDRAYADARLVREGDPEWRDDVPVRVETIPVPRGGPGDRGDRAQHQPARRPDAQPAGALLPPERRRADRDDRRRRLPVPRAARRPCGLAARRRRVPPGRRRGRVTYASPNALSVYRRLGLSGDLDGHVLADVTRDLVPPRRRPDEETLSAVLGGRAHRDTEVGDDQVVADRARRSRCARKGEHIGALVLVRDVTDLRRRDRELVTKDATIREIHHRVKNNLQTVAALLRLQARRIDVPRGPGRAGGGGPPGRVDRDRARDAQPGGARRGGFRRDRGPARRDGHRRRGAGGADRPSYAGRDRSGCSPTRRRRPWRWCSPSFSRTPWSTAIPTARDRAPIDVEPRAAGRAAAGTVDDDGVGLPAGFDPDTSLNLGLSIVRTLVESELGGLLELGPARSGGRERVVDVPLDGA